MSCVSLKRAFYTYFLQPTWVYQVTEGGRGGGGWRSEIGKKGDISDPGTSCPALVVAWRQKMQLFARLSSQIVGCRLTRAWTLLSVHFLFTLCNLCFDICVQNMLLVFQYLCSQFRCHHLTCQNYAYVPFLSNFWLNFVKHTVSFLLVWQSPICQDGNPTNHCWLMGWHVRVLCFPFDICRTK